MHYSKALLACASLVGAVVAQSPLMFIQVPASVQAGVATEIKWTGGDGSSPVTITLKKGDPANLQTVSTLTSSTGTSYTWTPSASVQNGQDYALQISQGTTSVNYSKQFPLTGGAATSPSGVSVTSVTVTAPATSSSAAGSTVTAVITTSVSLITTTVGASSTSPTTTATVLVIASNATYTSVSATLYTTTLGVSASSAIQMPRNTTFVTQTLDSTTMSGAGATSGGLIAGTGSSTATGTSGPGKTTGASASSPSPSTGDASGVGSPLAFVLCAFVAITYLS